MKIERVAAGAEQIRAVVDRDGTEGLVPFDVETRAPFELETVAVEIGKVERRVVY